MNIRQLEAFRAMMQAGTTKGAAELIGLSQPAVSRLIEAFEYAVDLPLFSRVRNRLTPTPEAVLLFEAVERTFASVDRIREAAADIRAADTGKLSLAALPALAFGIMPAALEAYRAQHPRTSVTLAVQTSARVEELAAAQAIDLGFAELPLTRNGVDVEPFCQTPLVLAVPPAHPLAGRSEVTPQDLTGEPLIALPQTSLSRQRLDQAFARAGMTCRPALEAQYSALVASLIARGLGIGLLDPFTAAGSDGRGLIHVPFRPSILFEVGVLHPTQRPLSRAARAFLAVIRRERAALLDPGLGG
ncbi:MULTISPECIES: LysR substrate-binding domain-containing protein [Methylobacterium]|uniref:LysR substrate-binding domain-containing protein n=1 Tax=Methylobacterium TaxID=407 RepID=UPI001586FE1D|nr:MULTISPECIES: LysR substrate-binding domain-containing protein [Methylobacterium]MBK3400736.1 LysR family transcriptional regulator [Methylobacterium ajmalii]MBK3408502.1 LysR family transcriptional regulator [Methylobacterium ajmalii]MBK3422767.1 LysR family transcriptional regulator [Methylobacterium ajmalii]MBZ6417166.1 LysR family transcriptional regulator [Methylobacterium sp.]